MKIESTRLEEQFLRGVRAAYYADHPWLHPNHPAQKKRTGPSGEEVFDQHLKLASGTSQFWQELLFWCERAYNGESRVHISRLPSDDQDGIIAAYRVLRGVVALEEKALGSARLAA